MIVFNTLIESPLQDVRVRRALNYAVNKEAIAVSIMGGMTRVVDQMTSSINPERHPNLEPYPYDPDKARSLYKKSGHSGKVVLRVAENAFPGAVDAAVLYQNQAKKAGIDIEVKREPNDGYWSNVWNAQPFCASYWTGRPVQDQMYATAYKSDADWNDTKWQRPKFDALLVKARGELDEKKRREIYREMALTVRDDGGAIIPMFNDWIDATRGVGGYVKDPNFKLSGDYAPIEAWLSE